MPNTDPGLFEESWLETPPFPDWNRSPTFVRPEELIGVLDLTTLQGDDSAERVMELAAKACGSQKVPPCSAVCVYPVFVETARGKIAVASVANKNVKVATVAGGFPHGLSPLEARIFEVESCQHADEIDVVIRRDLALQGKWKLLFDEVQHMRAAAGERLLKVILATGELKDPIVIYRASLCALMAGANFIKTSTGKEVVNATLEAGIPMAAALRVYQERTGRSCGIKAAGGIRTLADARLWHSLVYHLLGSDSCSANRFRIGASALYDDLASQI